MAHEDLYQFWVVWNPRGGQPTVLYTDGASAQREAERLAATQPGKRFYVLKGLRYFQVQATQHVELQPPQVPTPF